MKFNLNAFLPFVLLLGAMAADDYCYNPADKLCGPLVWSQLDIPNNECGGSRNSPISIYTEQVPPCEQLSYTFKGGNCRFGDLDYKLLNDVIKADFPSNCTRPTVMIGELEYEALQFHIHENSEHTINDSFFSAEFHIVHQLKSANVTAEPFAVIGFMLESGSRLGFFEPTIDGAVPGWISKATSVTTACNRTDPTFFYLGTTKPGYFINPYSLLPSNPKFYQYNGGLTTPPCTEAVWWNLLSESVQVGVAQLDTITRLILEYIDTDTCENASNADPTTGSTSRPPLDPIGRNVMLKGPFCETPEELS